MSKVVYDSMIELQFLNYIFKSNNFAIVEQNAIDITYFTTYKPHFEFIKEYYSQYHQLPSKETFQSKFNDSFQWINVTDPQEYLVDKLNEGRLYRSLINDFNDLANLIKAEKTDEAIEKMGVLSQNYVKQKPMESIDLISDAKKRYEHYLDKVNSPTHKSVSTGLKELDEILGGWDTENESAVVAARTGFGKSWWLIYFALQAAKQGMNVGFYSGEMDDDLVGYRLDTFLGGIANGSLTHGNENVRLQYEDYINTINSVVPGHIHTITPEMIGGFATVSRLKAFIEQKNINFLCVDQFSLLEDERHAKNPREQMSNLSKDLRALQRLTKIPIIAASQLNREEYEEGPSTRNISESDRVGHDATTVLFIERKNDNVIFTVGKARLAKSGDKLTYAWNINLGILSYVPTEKDALKGKGSDELEFQYNDSSKSNNIF